MKNSKQKIAQKQKIKVALEDRAERMRAKKAKARLQYKERAEKIVARREAISRKQTRRVKEMIFDFLGID